MRGPMPSIELDETPDIKKMSREELNKIPFDKWRIYCKVQGCNRFTHLRDYGIWPVLFGRFVGGDWINVHESYFLCHNHYKLIDKEKKQLHMKYYFSVDDIGKRINYSNDLPE